MKAAILEVLETILFSFLFWRLIGGKNPTTILARKNPQDKITPENNINNIHSLW